LTGSGLGVDRLTPLVVLICIMCEAHLGRMEEAREATHAGLELNPGFTIPWDRAAGPSDHPVFLASRERVHEGMRLAGVPEG
jgi:hypothetical protein